MAGNTLIFTYGTLKRGFSNHPLLQDMISSGDASLIGLFRTVHNFPLVCGPYRVPFLLNLPGSGHHRVSGELYSVSARALARMDELEGTDRGHYERLPIAVARDADPFSLFDGGHQKETQPDGAAVEAAAYFAHNSYAEALWRRNGERGYHCYTQEVARGYVKRRDRPPQLSFLDHIHIFLLSSNHGNPLLLQAGQRPAAVLLDENKAAESVA